jgi:alkylation response protein AidB-like acyl-CoA dehydrogenase
MQFEDSPEEAVWRSEVRAFIGTALPREINKEHFWEERASNQGAFDAWKSAIAERGWIAAAWPKEYGGAGLTVMEQFILSQELAEANAPFVGGLGVRLFGPTLITYGTDEQKREHLPPIVQGEVTWCQGYSEPGAGSDLAALQTRAVRDGDDFVINGQKIWTSFAHKADWCFLLARTNPDVPKHKGITYFMVNMRAPGITVRPLTNLANHRNFNEVFFEDVRVPAKNVVGEVDRGWYVGATTLDFERSSIANAVGLRQFINGNIRWLSANRGRITPTALGKTRIEWAERWLEVTIARLYAYRVISLQKSGKIPNAEASIAKLFVSELFQRAASTSTRMLGMAGGLLDARAPFEGYTADNYLEKVQTTIAGGTSEIQRNIIAMRSLGLPRG